MSRHRLVSPLLATLTLVAACSDTTGPVAPATPSAARAKPPVSAERIAFSRSTAGGQQIWTVRPDGTFPAPFSSENHTSRFPAWSPDGTRLAYVAGGIPIIGVPSHSIHVLDATTGTLLASITLFGSPDRNLAWTPDGAYLVYADEGGIYKVAATVGATPTSVCNAELYGSGAAVEAVPSPTGAAWAVIREKSGEPDRLYVMDPVACTQTEVPLPPGALSGVTWSPSGRQLAFASLMTEDFELYTVETTGAKRVRLTFSDGDDLRPAFSPDGRKLVFESKRGGNTVPRLFRMNVDGTGLLPLGANALGDAQPAWSR